MDDAVKWWDPTSGQFVDELTSGDGVIPANALKYVERDGAWVPTGETYSGDVVPIGGAPQVNTREGEKPNGGDLGGGDFGGGDFGGGDFGTTTAPTTTSGDFDADAALSTNQATIDSQGQSGVSYPGQWNGANPIRIQVGHEPGLYGNQVGQRAQGELEALGYQFSPGVDIKDLTERAAKSQYGYDASPVQANAIYTDAVRIAGVTGQTVQEVLKGLIKSGKGNAGSGGGGGGGGGPFSSTNTAVVLTDPGEAERALNTAMANYLGRRANDQEIDDFVKALNRNERFNPTVTKTEGVRSGNNTTQKQKQTGGFDSANFAQRWAAAQDDSAEYKAATTYMDSFSKVINAMEF